MYDSICAPKANTMHSALCREPQTEVDKYSTLGFTTRCNRIKLNVLSQRRLLAYLHICMDDGYVNAVIRCRVVDKLSVPVWFSVVCSATKELRGLTDTNATTRGLRKDPATKADDVER